jgi:hypothetical protein
MSLSLRGIMLHCVLLCLCFSAPIVVHAGPRSMAQWEKFDFSKERIAANDIKPLSLQDLKKLRGLVFARHGRVFDEKFIQDYISKLPWYRRNPKYHVKQLNAIERANMDTIKEAEWHRHKFVMTGDMKFNRNIVLTRARLGKPILEEVRVMRAEIEAIHGKRFKEDPWLQKFFEERYWYRPAARYDPSKLSKAERQNMALLSSIEKQMRKVNVAPGDMGRYQTQVLSRANLEGLSLYELRLLRNEIYARRGREFRTGWIAEYFFGQSWYVPNPNFKDSRLNAIEKRNLDTIVNYENELHADLSRKAIKPKLLQDLFLEDARKLRNEIYARRGRTFKDPWLNNYFRSFSWYKPKVRFSDSQLNAIERRNARQILDYEKKAVSLLQQVAA